VLQERNTLLQLVRSDGKGGATAEKQLLLTRKVTGIMETVLASELDRNVKMELSMSISKMLHLLLE